MLSIIKKCLQSSNEKCCEELTYSFFEIYDDEKTGKCFTSTTHTYDQISFGVTNSSNKSIHFFAIDRCIIPPSGPERCDCIISDKTTFCFIEIKEFKDTTKQKSKAKKKARSQLLSTIQLFLSNVLLPSDAILEAYMCVGTKGRVPSVQASDINVKMEFAQYNTDIFQGTTKIF